MPTKNVLRITTAAAAIVLAAAVAWAAGAFSSSRKYSTCVVADVSGSTKVARFAYLQAFMDLATDIGLHGSGRLWVVLAAGDPGADGTPVATSVAPDHPKDPTLAPGEVAQYVAQAADGLRQALLSPPVRGGGSAIVESTLQCAKVLHRGDRLALLSDGIQSSGSTGDFHTVDLTDNGITRLLGQLDRDHLLADLSGVSVTAPLIIDHAGGTNIPAERQQQIIRFWRAWASRVGARIDV